MNKQEDIALKIGSKLQNVCCKGYDWEIFDVVLDSSIIATYQGYCENPGHCPSACWCGEDDCMWNGITSLDHDSIGLLAI